MSSSQTKHKLFNVARLFYMLLILIVLLTTATYTWFSLSRAPKINDMSLYISSSAGLEISHSADAPDEEWSQNLIYSEHYNDNTVLRPVTYSDKDGKFYAANVGSDGRISDVSRVLSDERNANRDDINGYYVKFTFYARTSDSVTVDLISSASDDSHGTYVVGMPEWSSEDIVHNDGGQRLQSAMRMGFKITRYDIDGAEIDDEPIFVIYEPNCNTHFDYSTGYYPTESIDGTDSLVPAERLIRQNATAWIEASPVQKNVVVYRHGEFIDDTHLFDLDRGCTAKIEVYLWLEGQDVDCRFESDESAKILASIQFYAESNHQSGMEGIE